jgi:hypothetical protein
LQILNDKLIQIKNGFDLFMLAQCCRLNLEFRASEEVAKKLSRLWNQVIFLASILL